VSIRNQTIFTGPGCVDCISHSSVRVRGWIRMFAGYEPYQSYHISLWVLGLCAWIKVLHSILKIGQKNMRFTQFTSQVLCISFTLW
jgi:hypothetical protein